MIASHLEVALAEAEQCFSAVSVALVSGEPVALETSSAALRQAAMNLSTLLQRLPSGGLSSKELKLRLKSLAEGMSVQRESLIRRTVLVERALNAIVPAARKATYGQSTGTYGSPGKQTGAFKYLSA